MLQYYIFFILSAIIAAFRPVVFRKYKDYFIFGMFLSVLSMYIGSLLYMFYESRMNDNYNFKKKLLEEFNRKNLALSVISQIRFLTKQYAAILLPLTISIPLNNLWLVTATIFDKIINKTDISTMEYISIGILIIGGIIINFDKILNTKQMDNVSHINYIFGIVLILISIISGGYIYTMMQKIVSTNMDPGLTMGIESGGALILMTILLIGGLIIGKVKIPSFQGIVTMFLLLTILFNIDILFKFIGFEKISIIESIFLSQVYIFVILLIGIFYYKENITIYKIIGVIIIIIASIIGLYFQKNKKNTSD